MSGALIDYHNGIYAIDAHYMRERLAAIHLIAHDGRAAFVDTGTQYALPHAMQALENLGLGTDAVDYVILTHIHLDHAGGAGAMMASFPKAQLVVHPRGAPHMADPAKLVAGVEAVYGRERAQQMYGTLTPVARERIIEATDSTSIRLGSCELLCIDTPGHARHHIAIFDTTARGMFTGDTFGIAYPETNGPDKPFILPTTTPTQFDPEAMRASIRRMLDMQPDALYLTHFGQVQPPELLGQDMLRRIDGFVALTKNSMRSPDVQAAIRQGLADYIVAEARSSGCTASDAAILSAWAGDIELNAQGLALWASSGS